MEPIVDHEIRLRALEKELRDLQSRTRSPRKVEWYPTLIQNGVGIAATVTDSRWESVGGLVFLSCRFSVTGNSAGSGLIEVGAIPYGVPFSRSFSGGTFTYYDTSGAVHRVGVVRGTVSTSNLFFTVDNQSGNLGITPALVIGTGDGFSLSAWFAI